MTFEVDFKSWKVIFLMKMKGKGLWVEEDA